MKIYTRTGDKGHTTLFTGKKIPKNDLLMDAIGAVDETNSAIGSALSFFPAETNTLLPLRYQLETIQHALFDVGAALATPRTEASAAKIDKTRFDPEATKQLEEWIDTMESTLPPLKTFILPGGHPAGALLHLARSLCRRAERDALPLNQRGDLSDHVLMFLNRLSDYLFVSSRFLNHQLNSPETTWQPHAPLKNPS
ncbi:MAG: cob(I)yrinic acid a,c-diamide adenosyltransferase [Chlamydiia bacterium]|nr:cob(I)yrinic acid a,c-diamide adenosyltransferase [Chlamydiia bacterium]